MDYRTVGLKVGLEIHQQLATHKLFCEDASVLVDAPGGQRFRRRLRPTQSELGEVDAAAIEEAKRRLTFVYETTPNSCLVEADEEPPHPPNPEALDMALEIALPLDANPVTAGVFERTMRTRSPWHSARCSVRRAKSCAGLGRFGKTSTSPSRAALALRSREFKISE